MESEQRASRESQRLDWQAGELLNRYQIQEPARGDLRDKAQSATELYRAHGEAFVALAFRTFLDREPSSDEMIENLAMLRSGARKGDLAAQLRYSPEAKEHRQPFDLPRERLFRFFRQLPVLGGIANFLQALAGVAAVKRTLLAQQEQFRLVEDRFQRLDSQTRGLCREMIANNEALSHRINQESQSLRDRTGQLQDELDALQPRHRNGGSETVVDDDFYLAFEAHFRGSEEDIKNRLAYYLPIIRDNLAPELGEVPMADIGCGRGEWLDLLASAGYAATGVDLSVRNVESCRQRGLIAEQTDGVAWLRNRESQSLGLISAFHVIEHLSLAQLNSFLVEALRCLKPGGMMIVETPNPENLVTAAHRFYTDPSHRNPVPPDLTAFLLGYAGFTDVAIHRLHPPPESDRLAEESETAQRINRLLYGPQDYGAIAFKP